MGRAKDRLLEQEYQGWRFIDDKSVCERCFDDDALKKVVRSAAVEKTCDYCGRKSGKAIAAPMNEVMAVIARGIYSEWDDPVHFLPYESREGGYQGADLYDTHDLLETIEFPSEDQDLIDDVAHSLVPSLWCARDPFKLSKGDALRFGWERFCETVKYHSRYVFLIEEAERDDPYQEEVPVTAVLGAIGKAVLRARIVRTVARGTRFVRARSHPAGQRPSTVRELGPPTSEEARYSNRMSPAGIPMFYGADDAGTAVAETPCDEKAGKSMVTLATFETLQDLQVLDLIRLKEVPSIFDEGRRRLRSYGTFMRDFVHDLSAPVTKDGMEHIEYVPTQIVTEYFRRVFKTTTGQLVNGIRYPSSRHKAGKCVVFFAEQHDCCDAQIIGEPDSKLLLRLLPAETKCLTVDQARAIMKQDVEIDFDSM